MCYRPGLRNALDKVSFKVKEKQKVGIVGRTGSGKSTIIQTLFRLSEIQKGTIYISGEDIHKLGLHTLRQSLSYIPQQPFVMEGSIKENLDPFEESTEERIWEVLEMVDLKKSIEEKEEKLNTHLADNNTVFSAG